MKFLTYSELAAKSNVPIGTLYSRVHRKQIPFVRIGERTVRFDPIEIDTWLASQRVSTNP